MDKKLLSVYELAAYLNIGRNKALELLHADGFPTIRLGKRIFANKEQVDRWIDEQTGKQEDAQ